MLRGLLLNEAMLQGAVVMQQLNDPKLGSPAVWNEIERLRQLSHAHQSENATLKLAQQNPAGMQLSCHKEASIYCNACLLLCLH